LGERLLTLDDTTVRRFTEISHRVGSTIHFTSSVNNQVFACGFDCLRSFLLGELLNLNRLIVLFPLGFHMVNRLVPGGTVDHLLLLRLLDFLLLGVVVKDDIERGFMNVVPLWQFGMGY
jgi:hypothetical protein